MLALSEAIASGKVPGAEIALVLSDKADAQGLATARERGHETLVVERQGRKRAEHEAEIIDALKQHNVDLICLAGYMRVLSSSFIQEFPRRILNIHPSLLPSFPGLNVHQQAITHGVKWTGCTVHFVDDTLDDGPIIAQRVVPILDDDSEESLAARILEEEHQLYAEALALVVGEKFEVVGRKVVKTGKS
jgi:phosphoribosylglycinamide formyltransferase-1